VLFNIANLITGCRIALAPVLLLLAWHGREHLFLICFIVSLVSDVVDGQLARRLNLVSEFGARLDSWADLFTYIAVPIGACWLRPDLVTTEKVAFVALVVSYGLPVVVGFAKFRRLTSYHTLMARISACLVGASAVILFAHGPAFPFRIAVCVLVVAELEEICITMILPEPRANVRSLAAAIELKKHRLFPEKKRDYER
jgi:CDP-diacylglycerol---glycerol-3-phosphate 3-phosphatidyltransferase